MEIFAFIPSKSPTPTASCSCTTPEQTLFIAARAVIALPLLDLEVIG